MAWRWLSALLRQPGHYFEAGADELRAAQPVPGHSYTADVAPPADRPALGAHFRQTNG